jgi:hypothetical protein
MDMVLDQDLVLALETQDQVDLVEVQEHQVQLVLEVEMHLVVMEVATV